MTQTIGIVDVVWRGKRLPVEKGAKFTPGGLKNNTVKFGRGVARSQEFQESDISITTFLPKGVRYDDIVLMDEGELQVITDTGSTFTFPAAFLTKRPTVSDDGKFPLDWNAGEYEEIIS